MWYRRVIEVEEKRQSRKASSAHPSAEDAETDQKAKVASSLMDIFYSDTKEQDEPSDFRRVSLITKWSRSRSELVLPYVDAWRRGMISGGRVQPGISVHRAYVGNLNYKTTAKDLESFFRVFCGCEPLHVRIVEDRDTLMSRGFAFVEFTTAQIMEQAIERGAGTTLDGRTIRINEVRPREDRGSTRGGRGSVVRPSRTVQAAGGRAGPSSGW
ncbi:RNA binding motif (RNP1, RRM) protein 3 [Cladophialophora chaetospira]|uniref:RNA binding motif (RNP1, RRM) protein 3 n=1 Tax=Cladophialophora chaetospira TaxID=386627 RepID=A0AA39CP50_9EURO|nr:RNA binding motif (RNP1, RRM) protein 3 [Cladophialophora chaetospira]